MGQSVSLDTNDIESIKSLADKVSTMNLKEINSETIKDYIEKAINSLKALDEDKYKSEKLKQLVRLIANCNFNITAASLNTKEMTTWLTNNLKIHDLFKKILTYFMNLSDTEYSDRKFVIAHIIGALSNIMDDTVAVASIKTGLFEIALKIIENEKFLETKQLSESNSINLYFRIISFLYKNSKQSREDFPDDKKLDIINRLTKHKENLCLVLKNNKSEILELIHVYIVGTLSYLYDYKQLEQNDISNEMVQSLMKMINKAIDKSKANPMLDNTSFYFTINIENAKSYVYIHGFLGCLLRISVNDTIKVKINELDGVEKIIKILKESKNEEDQKVCAELLATLSLNEDIKQKLKSDETTMKLIEDKANTYKTSPISVTYKQIIDIVNGIFLQKPKASIDVKEIKEKYVMISYAHENKVNCHKLNTLLKQKGYKTWIDVENTMHNLFDALPKAVFNATIVLVCYSEAYFRSAMCRLEAENAFKENKLIIPIRMESKYKPDNGSWLNFLLGIKFYLDFSDANEIAENNPKMNQLFDRINSEFKEPEDNNGKKTDSTSNTDAKVNNCDNTSKNKHDAVKNWSNEDINEWLRTNKLEIFISLFDGYNGISLLALHKLSKINNPYFFKIIDDEINSKKIQVSLPLKLILFHSIDTLI